MTELVVTDDGMYSVEEVAAYLGVTAERVERLCYLNVLDIFPEGDSIVPRPGQRINGRSVLIYGRNTLQNESG